MFRRKMLAFVRGVLIVAVIAALAGPVSAAPAREVTYVVQSGDTLFSIARRFGVTVSAIANANGIANTHLIFVGQRLVIPTGSSASSTASSSSSAGACGRTYTVLRGDTLRIIAAKCGTTVSALVAANAIANPDLIFVGQRLALPSAAGAAALSPAAAGSPPGVSPAASPAPSSAPLTHGITGQFALCNPEKPSFAAKIERICFRETIFNNTSAPVTYTILGVNAANLGGGPGQFHTSWRGELTAPANDSGPVRGGWEDGLFIETPGTYRLTLSICYARAETCFLGTGWEVLTPGITVVVVDWQP